MEPVVQNRAFRPQLRWVEIRTVAGPSSVVQWVLRGGPNTVWSHVRHRPGGLPAAVTEPGLMRHQYLPGAEGVSVGHRVGGWMIHFPAVVCTSSLSTLSSLCAGAVVEQKQVVGYSLPPRGARRRIPLTWFTA